MRRILFAAVGLLFGSGCIAGGSMAVERDDRILREISRQDRWTQQALDARPTRDQLDTIRSGDSTSVGAARKELQKLFLGIDRGTWVRDTAAELLRDDAGDPQLNTEFQRGGRLRTDSIEAADELAEALAEVRGGLTVADLKPGFDALHKAQASEDKLARQKLPASPVPTPRPFVDAAAKVIQVNPDLKKELDRLAPDDQAQVRAQLAELDRSKEEQKHAAPAPPADTAAPPPPVPEGEKEAEAPSPTLKIAGDAADLIAKKPPRSITLREDGLFALSYDDADYLVDPNGKLVRKETPEKK